MEIDGVFYDSYDRNGVEDPEYLTYIEEHYRQSGRSWDDWQTYGSAAIHLAPWDELSDRGPGCQMGA